LPRSSPPAPPPRHSPFPYTTLFRSSRVRSAAGTSSTERYTRSEPPAEIITVDVWNMPAGLAFGSPQCGHADADSANFRLHEGHLDRKSTRLNSSHRTISYAVFCLKK